MKMKRKEFLALKQGAMSVTEYRDKFLQLARYAPADVAETVTNRSSSWRDLMMGSRCSF